MMPGLRTSGGCRFNERHQTIGLAFTSHFKEEPSGDGFHQELLSWQLLRLSSINKNKEKNRFVRIDWAGDTIHEEYGSMSHCNQ